MQRRARLTVLELGASPVAWASCRGLGADDWIVVAQTSDESVPEFTARVSQRARRLRREDARIEVIDVYAAPRSDAPSSVARRSVIEELADQMEQGGRLTLWSSSDSAQSDAELSDILAQFAPILAKRQIAMNHQTCEVEQKSGIRNAIPTRPTSLSDDELGLEDFG